MYVHEPTRSVPAPRSPASAPAPRPRSDRRDPHRPDHAHRLVRRRNAVITRDITGNDLRLGLGSRRPLPFQLPGGFARRDRGRATTFGPGRQSRDQHDGGQEQHRDGRDPLDRDEAAFASRSASGLMERLGVQGHPPVGNEHREPRPERHRRLGDDEHTRRVAPQPAVEQRTVHQPGHDLPRSCLAGCNRLGRGRARSNAVVERVANCTSRRRDRQPGSRSTRAAPATMRPRSRTGSS